VLVCCLLHANQENALIFLEADLRRRIDDAVRAATAEALAKQVFFRLNLLWLMVSNQKLICCVLSSLRKEKITQK
jgi:hypothetical protein